jgi:hypothetical protein
MRTFRAALEAVETDSPAGTPNLAGIGTRIF